MHERFICRRRTHLLAAGVKYMPGEEMPAEAVTRSMLSLGWVERDIISGEAPTPRRTAKQAERQVRAKQKPPRKQRATA